MGIGGALFGSSSKGKAGGGGVVALGDGAGDGVGLTAAGGLFGVTTGAGELNRGDLCQREKHSPSVEY